MASPVIAGTDRGRIDALKNKYPYFVPVRYIRAVHVAKGELAPGVLSSITPYLGNWLLFCDFIAGKEQGSAVAKVEEAIAPVVDEQVIETPSQQTAIAELQPEADQPEPERPEPQQPDTPIETPAVAAPVQPMPLAAEPVADTMPAEATMQEMQHRHIGSVLDGAMHAITDDVTDEQLISPVYTEDYFRQQGVKISDALPDQVEEIVDKDTGGTLMVMMSFTEWLLHFRNKSQKEKEEDDEQKALKTMWQKEKLAAAMEEENEEIPENVFEMAVNSITSEDDLASEPLANIYLKQGKYDRAIDMYRKLSLRNPQKNAYFARKIEEILKEKQS